MKLYGIKKVTLIDYPGKIACTVFTYGCNLRCPFCHNPELVTEAPSNTDTISDQEVLDFLKKRGSKIDGIVITGGEPLLHKWDLETFLTKIKKLGYNTKLDTNGTDPTFLKKLVKKGLVDFVAMDFKSGPEKYSQVMKARASDFDKVLSTLEFLRNNTVDYEIRTTVVPDIHDEQELKKMLKFLKDIRKYVIQNFVPNGMIDKSYSNKKGFTGKQLKDLKKISETVIEHVEIRNDF